MQDVEKEMQDKNQTKNDDLLDQFDQFVVHAEMEKRKKVQLTEFYVSGIVVPRETCTKNLLIHVLPAVGCLRIAVTTCS
jgi:hypothetical protein